VDHQSNRYGLVATAVTSVSAEPPTLLVCVNGSASIFPVLSAAKNFCVNVLSRDQHAIAARFASPENRESRFEIGRWTTLRSGAPALEGAQVSFDCRISGTAKSGTHTVFFGEVLALDDWGAPLDPLIYHDGSFATVSTGIERKAA
jgi:flavin reductase